MTRADQRFTLVRAAQVLLALWEDLVPEGRLEEKVGYDPQERAVALNGVIKALQELQRETT